MALETTPEGNQIMFGIDGIVDGYEGHGGETTPQNHAQHVAAVAANNIKRAARGEALIEPFTIAELEAGIVVRNQRRADATTERNSINVLIRKMRQDGFTTLTDIQKNRLMRHLLRDPDGVG
tara:strand:- start:170 stop:535 length:366 start_codon:yes stop_codon:yes gene_type:complete